MEYQIYYFRQRQQVFSDFQKTFKKMYDSSLNFSNNVHPQIDGQMKVVNRIFGNLIHSICEEKTKQRDVALAQIEFAYNSVVHRSTIKVPFAIVQIKPTQRALDLLKLLAKMGLNITTTNPHLAKPPKVLHVYMAKKNMDHKVIYYGTSLVVSLFSHQ